MTQTTQPLLPLASRAGAAGRRQAVARATVLNRLTIAWNVVEGGVAIAAGAAAGSISLIGFGIDSGVEVSAAVILGWRLRQERSGGCMQPGDRRATQAIVASLIVLAIYVGVEAVLGLASGARPEVSYVGIAIAALSLIVMPLLARAKRQLAPALGSRAVEADAAQTDICGLLSAVMLVGLGAYAAFGWWWADSVSALGIAALAATQGARMWRAGSLADMCCS